MKLVPKSEPLSVFREGADISFLQERMGPTEKVKSSFASSSHAGKVQREIERAALETAKRITLDQINLMGARIRAGLIADAVPQFAAAMTELTVEMGTYNRNLTAATMQGVVRHIEMRDEATRAFNALERDGKLEHQENLALQNLNAAMTSEDIIRSENLMQKVKKVGETLADGAIVGIERAASSVKL